MFDYPILNCIIFDPMLSAQLCCVIEVFPLTSALPPFTIEGVHYFSEHECSHSITLTFGSEPLHVKIMHHNGEEKPLLIDSRLIDFKYFSVFHSVYQFRGIQYAFKFTDRKYELVFRFDGRKWNVSAQQYPGSYAIY